MKLDILFKDESKTKLDVINEIKTFQDTPRGFPLQRLSK